MLEITKLEAAARQLDTAITLVFEQGDRVVVHTLAAAAANIFSDVLESQDESRSWRQKAKSQFELSNAQY